MVAMRTAAVILLTASAVIFAAGPLAALWLALTAKREQQADAKKRAEQDRQVSAEWLALLAATEPTPIYDALVCESIEKAEGWVA